MLIGQAIGFQLRRVDDRFQQFFAIADHVGAQDFRQCFDLALQILRDLQQHALGNSRAADCNLDDRRGGGRHLLHQRLFCGPRESCLGLVDGGAGFEQRLTGVKAHIKLHNHGRSAFAGEGADLGDAFDGLQFYFCGLGQQAFSIFRRNALVDDGGDDDGDSHIRVQLHGD